jgi:hypothetical protein
MLRIVPLRLSAAFKFIRRGMAAMLYSAWLTSGMPAAAAVVNLNPSADAFVAAAQPANNYGAAGALAIAAPELSNGEFQSVMRFDASAAKGTFDALFGLDGWEIQSVTLRLTATSPNNPLFNVPAAGQFQIEWTQNDTWVEGTGGPNNPSTSGISFSTLPAFLGGADESLGSFSYNGATSGSTTYSLALTSGLTTDIAAGDAVGLRLFAADGVVSYVFNSRNFPTASGRPELSITAEAVPEPATFFLLACGAAVLLRRIEHGRAPRREHVSYGVCGHART